MFVYAEEASTMATIEYSSFTGLETSTAYHENVTYLDMNVTEAVSTNSVPRMVNLICRPIWVITGTVGKNVLSTLSHVSPSQIFIIFYHIGGIGRVIY